MLRDSQNDMKAVRFRFESETEALPINPRATDFFNTSPLVNFVFEGFNVEKISTVRRNTISLKANENINKQSWNYPSYL